MNFETMIIVLILFVSSWIGSWLLYQLALVTHYSFFGRAEGFHPYRCGTQRALTWLEVIAEKRIYDDMNSRYESSVESIQHMDIRPGWVKLLGYIVDLLFITAVVLLFFTLFSIGIGNLIMVGIIYMGAGCVIFFFHLIRLGEIGNVGYHLRFLLYLFTWPFFVVFVRKNA